MEGSHSCKNCRKRTIVPDDVTGNMVCSSCGVVQEYDNFVQHVGGITGVAGTYVRVGTAGTGSMYSYKETKIYEAQKLIEDSMYKLGLSGSTSQEVKHLVQKITDGEYGQGRWFPVFVGACAYVVMRKNQKTLPMVEVADIVGCDVYELGRMINRVVDFTDLKLPEFDIVNSFKRAIKSCPSFAEVSNDAVERMLQQGVFLVQCLIKWFVTTGRQPMPVVAAVLIFVAELNQVCVKIEDVAKELHVAIITCRRRHKELLERLVKVAQILPWGKDVTVKNIMKNAPFVIQYMEMKSKEICSRKRKGFEVTLYDIDAVGRELLGECLGDEIGHELDCFRLGDNDSHYFRPSQAANTCMDLQDRFQISPESLSLVYSNFVNEISTIKDTIEIGIENGRKKQKMFELQECMDWWSGKSELSKKLLLKQILEKDVGLDATPPSFDKACSDVRKRREKIGAAKLRIQRIMHPGLANSGYSNSLCPVEPEKPNKKRKKMAVDLDWEDLIIETLLLHNVKEEEIENGHYNVLFALHVFGDHETNPLKPENYKGL